MATKAQARVRAWTSARALAGRDTLHLRAPVPLIKPDNEQPLCLDVRGADISLTINIGLLILWTDD
jgi:hypothetical protein